MLDVAWPSAVDREVRCSHFQHPTQRHRVGKAGKSTRRKWQWLTHSKWWWLTHRSWQWLTHRNWRCLTQELTAGKSIHRKWWWLTHRSWRWLTHKLTVTDTWVDSDWHTGIDSDWHTATEWPTRRNWQGVWACVVSVIVKCPVFPPCAVDGHSRNPLYSSYYYLPRTGLVNHTSAPVTPAQGQQNICCRHTHCTISGVNYGQCVVASKEGWNFVIYAQSTMAVISGQNTFYQNTINIKITYTLKLRHHQFKNKSKKWIKEKDPKSNPQNRIFAVVRKLSGKLEHLEVYGCFLTRTGVSIEVIT